MIRNALLSQESATVLGNQHIVLDTDTAKVLVGLDFVEVQELLAVA